MQYNLLHADHLQRRQHGKLNSKHDIATRTTSSHVEANLSLYPPTCRVPFARRKRKFCFSNQASKTPRLQAFPTCKPAVARALFDAVGQKYGLGCYTKHTERCIVHIQTKPCAARSNSRWRQRATSGAEVW